MSPRQEQVQQGRAEWRERVAEAAGNVQNLKQAQTRLIDGVLYQLEPLHNRWVRA